MSRTEPFVTILMCTYNGQKYLKEQLLSLLNQTYDNFEIIIYDDLSSDSTINIISEVMATCDVDRKIQLFENTQNSGGACENFRKIIQDYCDRKYIMFCDQDDLWELNKISVMMSMLLRLEHEKNIPYLVCHPCALTNENNEIIGHYAIKNTDFHNMIFHPIIPGCCMLLNHKAVELLQLFDSDWYMHDWYISLVVALKGAIKVLNEELIQYRQHADNQIGCRPMRLSERIQKVIKDTTKVTNYQKALKQLHCVATLNDSTFCEKYLLAYAKKDVFRLLKLFYENRVLNFDLHGLYQGYIAAKALHKIN